MARNSSTKSILRVSAAAAMLALVSGGAADAARMFKVPEGQIIGAFKKALNGKRKGGSVKAMARKAAKQRSVRRAKRRGQA